MPAGSVTPRWLKSPEGGRGRFTISDAWWIPFLVVGMLITGSANTLSKKAAYQTESEGEKWSKPWTCTLIMFTGECMCMVLFALRQPNGRWFTCRQPNGGDKGGNGAYASLPDPAAAKTEGEDETPPVTLRSGLVCILPACCDLGGTTLSGIGLLFTTASVWQMLRGSIILFTGILSVAFLKRRLEPFKWLGMFIVICGITIVGVASVNAPMSPLVDNCCCRHQVMTPTGQFWKNVTKSGTLADFDACTSDPNRTMVAPQAADYDTCAGVKSASDSHLTAIGDLLIIVSQLMSGFQMVVEEKFLKGEGGRQLPSEFVVGCEGFFGAVMMSVVFVPLLMHLPSSWDGIYEDIPEGFRQLGHNSRLFGVVFCYWCSIAFYNFFGLSVAGKLSAVHRTLVDACRTIVVWIISLSIFYGTSNGGEDCVTDFGEGWHGKWSTVQLVGFLIMMFGTFTYYKVFRLPCLPDSWYDARSPKLTLDMEGEDDEDDANRSFLLHSDSE